MRRAIAWLVGGLPFDARSRRTLDETLLDWEGEATEAKTLSEAAVTELRGVLSVARVTWMSVVREAVDVGWLRGLGGRFAVVGLIVLALTVLFCVGMVWNFGLGMVEVVPFYMAAVLFAILPTALFLIIAWRPRGGSRPSVGTALVLTAGLFALTQWALPHWQWRAQELTWPYVKADLEAKGVALNPSYLPKPRKPPLPLTSLGSACVAGAGIILAGALARRRTIHSRLWLLGIPFLHTFVPRALTLAIGIVFLNLRMFEYRDYAEPTALLLMTTGTLLLAAKYDHRTDELILPTTPESAEA
jgi:hypothetical protein